MSNWDDATRQRRWAIDSLQCPKCASMNIPGAWPTIEIQQDGRALCATCSHCWPVKPPAAA